MDPSPFHFLSNFILFLFSITLYHFVSLWCLSFLLFGFIKLIFISLRAREMRKDL